MVTQKDVTVIDKDKIPVGRVVGTYTFLRDMGKALAKGQALQVPVADASEAKKVTGRWRAYFKGRAHSNREVKGDKITVFLSLD